MPAEAVKRGPWRRLGQYIGRDVWLADGSRTTELQHRVVAAQKVGRALRTDEHAHHENEQKTDNRPENGAASSSVSALVRANVRDDEARSA